VHLLAGAASDDGDGASWQTKQRAAGATNTAAQQSTKERKTTEQNEQHSKLLGVGWLMAMNDGDDRSRSITIQDTAHKPHAHAPVCLCLLSSKKTHEEKAQTNNTPTLHQSPQQ